MQSSMRVRHLNNDTLYYGCYPKYLGDERFNVVCRDRLRAIINGQHNGVCSSDQMLANRRTLAPWLKTVWVCNHQENNVSAFMHERLLGRFLDECGYERE